MLADEKERRRVQGLVNRFLSPSYDREFIATQIIIDAWIKNVERISYAHIKHKCANAFRRRQVEQKNLIDAQLHAEFESSDEQMKVVHDLVNILIKFLTPHERKLIWMSFYKGMSQDAIAAELHVGKPRVNEELRVALYKMQQEVGNVSHKRPV